MNDIVLGGVGIVIIIAAAILFLAWLLLPLLLLNRLGKIHAELYAMRQAASAIEKNTADTIYNTAIIAQAHGAKLP